MTTDRFLSRFAAVLKSGQPLVLAGVGSGLTARGAVEGGADALAVYSNAIYRIRGLPTALAFLPYDNANTVTLRTLPEIVAAAGDVPVFAGVGAHDPRLQIDAILDSIAAIGASGVANEPFLGIYGKDLKAQLEAAGLGFEREIVLIRRAVDHGMLTLGWAFSPEEAYAMADAGAHLVGAMIGVTAGGPAGGASLTSLDDAIGSISAMAEAAVQARSDAIVLCHGGPLVDSISVGELLRRSRVHGYVTGSTGERMPAQRGVAEAVRSFKCLRREAD